MMTTSPGPASNRSLGAILVDSGELTIENAERILHLQREQNLRFGDAAIKLGLLTEDHIRFALSKQFDYPYLSPLGDRRVSDELVAAYHPFSPQVEQMRALRSQLMLRWFDKDTRRVALAVVGAERSEGRSYLAANLAIVFSQLGERTLLIDADMRAPRQHQLFKLDPRQGLSTLLSGRAEGEGIVRIEAFANLSVLPAGATPPNPQELLNRPAFGELLARVGAQYDVVLIDTAAFATGADAGAVAGRAGAALVLARKHETRIAALDDFVKSLGDAGVTLVGAVLNSPPANGRKQQAAPADRLAQ
jgi:receptor protein-tyrosine kinase